MPPNKLSHRASRRSREIDSSVSLNASSALETICNCIMGYISVLFTYLLLLTYFSGGSEWTGRPSSMHANDSMKPAARAHNV